jgi:hypothetical protein
MSRMVALSTFLLLASSVLATTTATAPAGTPEGGTGDYRWVIFLFAITVAAVVYFLRSRRSRV